MIWKHHISCKKVAEEAIFFNKQRKKFPNFKAIEGGLSMAKIQGKIKKILEEYIEEVSRLCPVDKAFLFGSHAQGLGNKKSDIDIAIFSRDINDENRLKIMSEIIMLIDKFKIDIQPIVFSYQDYFDEDNDFILNEIKKKGVVIK